MENTYFVNVWINNIVTQEQFKSFIEIRYTDDGDMISQFLSRTGLSSYPTEGQEFFHHENPVSIEEAFEGHSYLEDFESQLLADLRRIGINKIQNQYLLYDFDKEHIDYISNNSEDLNYIGKYEFQP